MPTVILYCHAFTHTYTHTAELTPFTTYSVAVAALTSEGQGPDSAVETNMTFQGCEGIHLITYIVCLYARTTGQVVMQCDIVHLSTAVPTMPSHLTVDDCDNNFITLSWLPPETPNGIVDLYRVTYQGFKDDYLTEVYVNVHIQSHNEIIPAVIITIIILKVISLLYMKIQDITPLVKCSIYM